MRTQHLITSASLALAAVLVFILGSAANSADSVDPSPSAQGVPSPSAHELPSPSAQAPSPSAQELAALAARGIPPQGQALLGSASGNAAQDPRPREALFGRTLAIHRTYWRGDQVERAVEWAARDIAAGRLPWISFKAPHDPGTSTPYTWTQMAAGAGDAWAVDLAERLAELDGPVWVAVHHEPENDSGSLPAWTQMQRRLSPIFRAKPNIAYTVILMGYPQFRKADPDPQLAIDALWPGAQFVDVTGFDPYNWYGTLDASGRPVTTFTELDEYYQPISQWAESVGGARWAISETGLTDVAAERDADWIIRAFDDMKARGGIAMAYWDNEFLANPANTFALDTPSKQQAFAHALARSARVPDPGPSPAP